MYRFMLSEWQTQRLITALEAVRDSRVMTPRDIQQILDYIRDEIETQDHCLELARQGIDPYAEMKIKVPTRKSINEEWKWALDNSTPPNTINIDQQ